MKVGIGCRNDFCFTIAKISDLVVRVFHDLVQPPSNGLCNTKILAAPKTNYPPSLILTSLLLY